jgi:hypothetical protein
MDHGLNHGLADGDIDSGIVLTDEQKRHQRARSIAIALSLGSLALLFFVLTIVRFGAAAANHAL